MARVAVDVLKIPPDSIMFITLTNAAAENMRVKLTFVHKYADTSHALAATILSEYGVLDESSGLYNCDVGLLDFYEWLKAKTKPAKRFLSTIKCHAELSYPIHF